MIEPYASPAPSPDRVPEPVDAGAADPVDQGGTDHGDGAEAAHEPSDTGDDYGGTAQVDPRIADHFTAHMEQSGGSPEAVSSALEWLNAAQGRSAASLDGQQVEHAYDFRSINVSPEDRRHLDDFGNFMAKRGASQEDVTRAVDYYFTLKDRVGQAQIANAVEVTRVEREIEAQDRQERDRTRGELQVEWGVDYEFNVRTVNRYLDTLSPRQRTRIENEMRPDGRLALNDPKRLGELLETARSSRRSVQGGDLTRAEIERTMREDRDRYNSDLSMQDRYRQLLEGGTSERNRPMPSSRTGIDAEIAGIERLMRTDRQSYNSQEGRYRELLRIRDGDN